MDLMARINQRKTQSLLQSWGCKVLRTTRRARRAVIEIDAPTPFLQANAAGCFAETVNGQRKNVGVVFVNSCLVHWHTEVQQ